MKTFRLGPRVAVTWGYPTQGGWLWKAKTPMGAGALWMLGTKKAWIAVWPRTLHRKHIAKVFATYRAKGLALAPLPC